MQQKIINSCRFFNGLPNVYFKKLKKKKKSGLQSFLPELSRLLSGAASKPFFFSYACLVCLTEHDYFFLNE